MNALLKLVGATAGAMLAGAVAVILLVPPTPEERRMFRQFEAEGFVRELTAAAWAYRAERGRFPAGDGHGSAGLAAALAERARDGRAFLDVSDALRTPEGDLRNPYAPAEEVLHYRNNEAVPNAAARNRSSFDLWGRGSEGPEAVNNWGGSVPLP